ncbi:OsmC family protein [uncultured Maritalea sp.]|uniref:OsmC family protein n=1 Tax=uncultured Maritalea sp. TaxID=757249 RepID=UPI00261FFF76|nr:OsmC family protein [uncultured Maritalea sp.]
MLEYNVTAIRKDATASLAQSGEAEIMLDTGLKGRPDALNPAELFLASIAACMIKGIERVCPILDFELSGVRVQLHAKRQDAPPMITHVNYEILVNSQESDARLDLLHKNVKKYGTIFNTVSKAVAIEGRLVRSAENDAG